MSLMALTSPSVMSIIQRIPAGVKYRRSSCGCPIRAE